MRRSFKALQGHLFELMNKLFHPALCWHICYQGLQSIFLASNPPHNGASDKEAELIRQLDGQGTRLPNS